MSYSSGIVNLETSLPQNLNLKSNWSIELGKGENKIENKKEKDQNHCLGRLPHSSPPPLFSLRGPSRLHVCQLPG
jgi:hypothetical protein